MKKQIYTVIALMVLVGSLAVAAEAQNAGRTQLVANIPFEFNVGNKSLPAGTYLVLSVNADSSNVVVMIQSRDGKHSAMSQTNTIEGKAQDTVRLIFHRYGNQYFFAQAWDGAKGLQAPKSRAERAAESELAGIKQTETVALAALR